MEIFVYTNRQFVDTTQPSKLAPNPSVVLKRQDP